eukprot:CAMPEP_0198133012 /NCGR_PEP_ID=MMETSP1442-20131203/59344_1 /TAXON_ID= /ORGANISM="Craspedostauros australis, Strain CCMP3328" /LENGTH=220 /DNA_ID=CAMNT_0043794115 /DNA_START=8 /DNA_END=670 /DNA_ORIENTATION=+
MIRFFRSNDAQQFEQGALVPQKRFWAQRRKGGNDGIVEGGKGTSAGVKSQHDDGAGAGADGDNEGDDENEDGDDDGRLEQQSFLFVDAPMTTVDHDDHNDEAIIPMDCDDIANDIQENATRSQDSMLQQAAAVTKRPEPQDDAQRKEQAWIRKLENERVQQSYRDRNSHQRRQTADDAARTQDEWLKIALETKRQQATPQPWHQRIRKRYARSRRKETEA